MFSGIIEDVAEVLTLVSYSSGKRLMVRPATLPVSEFLEGESVSLSGVCLTVAGQEGGGLAFDLSAETLARTVLSFISRGDFLNLERALKVGDRIHGHFVTGHVDGMGEVREIRKEGEFWTVKIFFPSSLSPFLAEKGSVAVNGISLTVAKRDATCLLVSVIPFTLSMTNFGKLREGDRVNLEVDLLARYFRESFARGKNGAHEANLS